MVKINQALADMLGCTIEEVTDTLILDYTHPDCMAYWYDLHEALWKKELPKFSLDACLIRKDGKQIWCIVHTIRFVDHGEVMGDTINWRYNRAQAAWAPQRWFYKYGKRWI